MGGRRGGCTRASLLANGGENLPPKALGLSQRRNQMTAFRRRQGLPSSYASPSRR